MLQNIFETVIRGSNTIFLDIHDDDYFFAYDTISMENAEDIAQNYFRMKQKDGIPYVKDIDFDSSTHKVKIIVEVQQDRDKKLSESYVPDVLNITRRQ